MPTIKELNQTREDKACLGHVSDLQALYVGGEAFKAKLDKFLPAKPFEPWETHAARKNEAAYRNYLGPIVDYFASMLFSERPVAKAKLDGKEVTEPDKFWSEFREDADANGGDLDAVFKDRLTQAMISGKSWLRVHAPTVDRIAESKLEFDELGLGECWLEPLAYDQVLDWETDQSGRLEWAITHRTEAKRTSISGDRKNIVETWEFLTPDSIETYAVAYHVDRKPSEETQVSFISSVPHPFGAVPLVRLELPTGLWVASRLETPQLAHFRTSNAQTWGMSRSCFAMPVLKLAEQDKPPVMGAGNGILLGLEESLEWASPSGIPFEALGKEIAAQKDEIYRIAHQMALGVDNNAAAVGRSADSKATDAASTRVILLSFSRIVKEAIERTYDLIGKARGEELTWSIDGLDDFAALDVNGFAETLALVDKVGGIPSKTFEVQTKQRLAEALLRDLDETTKATIRKEIEANAKDPAEKPELPELGDNVPLGTKPVLPGKPLPAPPPS